MYARLALAKCGIKDQFLAVALGLFTFNIELTT
jgi:hypothetical protein